MSFSTLTQFYTPEGILLLAVVAYLLAVAKGEGPTRWWGGLTGILMCLALAFLPDIPAMAGFQIPGLSVLASFTLPVAGALLALMVGVRAVRLILHLIWSGVTH